MPVKDLGAKYTCYQCGTRFYDLKRPAPICPKCGADQRRSPGQKAPPAERRRAPPKAVAEPPIEAAPEDVEEEAKEQVEEEDEELGDDEA